MTLYIASLLGLVIASMFARKVWRYATVSNRPLIVLAWSAYVVGVVALNLAHLV